MLPSIMNAFKAARIPTRVSMGKQLFEEGLYQLTQQLEISLFQDMNCYMIKTLRNMYRYMHLIGSGLISLVEYSVLLLKTLYQ